MTSTVLKLVKSGPLRGTVTVPGDKSITHRAVIFGAMATGVTTVHDYLPSEDCRATIGAFQAMGVSIVEEGSTLTINSPGWQALTAPTDVIDCGNSGTTARLLTGLLSGLPFTSRLTGDDSLRRRPMGRVMDPLASMGARIEGEDGGDTLPLTIHGSSDLEGIEYYSPVASAQVKTALLLAGLTVTERSRVAEPIRSRDHSERMLPAFGAELSVDELTVSVWGGKPLTPTTLTVPGDPSSAAFLLAAATLVPDSEVTVKNVGLNPTRSGFIYLLRQMGADLTFDNHRTEGGEPVADITVRHAPLRGVEVDPMLVPTAIDEFPILFVLAACAEGVTSVAGAEELRVKESDRLTSMAIALTDAGARVKEHKDGLEISGGNPVKGTTPAVHGDHRLAMSMAVLGLIAEGETVIDATPIATSFPTFADLLAQLGAPVESTS